MKVPYAALGAVLLLFLLPKSFAQQMSPEEVIVRTTYAKLAFAVQIEEIHKITDEQKWSKSSLDPAAFAKRMNDAELRFELSDFKVGGVHDPGYWVDKVQRSRYETLRGFP